MCTLCVFYFPITNFSILYLYIHIHIHRIHSDPSKNQTITELMNKLLYIKKSM